MQLRKATTTDAMLYYNWANDEAVRKNSLRQNRIEWEHHRNWFAQKLQSEQSYLYILEEEGIPVGQIRYDIADGEAIIGFSIDRAWRGQGMGKAILQKSIPMFQQEIRDRVQGLKAVVKHNNIASLKVFESLGFSHSKDIEVAQQACTVFRLPIGQPHL
ncbi:MAG: GNAT family N-acetyltransferase [Bacteroidota bacterium]